MKLAFQPLMATGIALLLAASSGAQNVVADWNSIASRDCR
jgi:hypothetical protein